MELKPGVIALKKGFFLHLPKNYQKVKLPGLKKWLKALRSGKYRQTVGTLCETRNKRRHFCCLGVLSETQGRLIKKDISWRDIDQMSVLSQHNPLYSIFGDTGKFPEGVFIEEDGDMISTNLSWLNDCMGFSFKEIADVAELIWTE